MPARPPATDGIAEVPPPSGRVTAATAPRRRKAAKPASAGTRCLRATIPTPGRRADTHTQTREQYEFVVGPEMPDREFLEPLGRQRDPGRADRDHRRRCSSPANAAKSSATPSATPPARSPESAPAPDRSLCHHAGHSASCRRGLAGSAFFLTLAIRSVTTVDARAARREVRRVVPQNRRNDRRYRMMNLSVNDRVVRAGRLSISIITGGRHGRLDRRQALMTGGGRRSGPGRRRADTRTRDAARSGPGTRRAKRRGRTRPAARPRVRARPDAGAAAPRSRPERPDAGRPAERRRADHRRRAAARVHAADAGPARGVPGAGDVLADRGAGDRATQAGQADRPRPGTRCPTTRSPTR